MDWVDRSQNYKDLDGVLQLLQGSHLDNFPLKTLKLGWVAFNLLKFQLKCLDFQSKQYKKLAPVLTRFCNGLLNCHTTSTELVLQSYGQSTSTVLPCYCCFSAPELQFYSHSTSTELPCYYHSTETLLPLYCHATPTPLALNCHITSTELVLQSYCQSTNTELPCCCCFSASELPFYSHSTSTELPCYYYSTATLLHCTAMLLPLYCHRPLQKREDWERVWLFSVWLKT